MGFVETNNGRGCKLHPDSCENSLVLERNDHGVSMQLRLRMMVPDELACYATGSDGSGGCYITFVANECAVGERALLLNGVIVRIVEVFYPTKKTEPHIASTTITVAML
jgi:hypothetical protein